MAPRCCVGHQGLRTDKFCGFSGNDVPDLPFFSNFDWHQNQLEEFFESMYSLGFSSKLSEFKSSTREPKKVFISL
jgi:hypothetical protein